MDESSLEIFLAVAAELSITRAAVQLGRVQSNVTTRIQQLEKDLGVDLFRREGKRLSLTPEGERFRDYANRMVALTQEMRQAMHPRAPSGKLRIGCMESTAATRLPGPLALFHQRWPQVELNVVTGPSRAMLEATRNGLVDCAFIALYGNSEIRSRADLLEMGLRGARMYEEELVLVLPADHPPVRKAGDVAVRSLAAFGRGCSYRALAEDWLAPRDPALKIQEVASYHAMLACVTCGACTCLMPRAVLNLVNPSPALRVRDIARMDTWLVWRAGFNAAAFSALREILPAGKPA
ncbi:LysR substrate-binding domain-containing protein [uncultured Azohydromonas sp.]|jgi:Transcriptional regulator|uniref:LysR substrate-binding domain-containing protein n=1 Tax=uncultured Azohydromonas sp. TaxID=487342 RepID=UPI002614095D|nr:LysR substrate-binding domain-containing protein [uncultured Azohydromonas sp.]